MPVSPPFQIAPDVEGPFAPGDYPQAQDDGHGGVVFRPAPAPTSYDPNVPQVLRLLGPDFMHHILCGLLWPNGPVTMGPSMAVSVWIKIFEGGIVLIDGYGGAHVLGWTVASIPGVQGGNFWNGSAPVAFSGTYVIGLNEWVHLTLLFNGDPSCQKLFVYTNGICDGQVTLTQRVTLPWANGNGHLAIGGVDHQCIGADYAHVELWEEGSPLALAYPLAFVPNRYDGMHNKALSGSPPGVMKSFNMDCSVPGVLIDTSPRGFPGELYPERTFHHGLARGLAAEFTDPPGSFEGVAGLGADTPTPQWVPDPTSPWKQAYGSPLPDEDIPSPKPVPPGALAFESWGRRNETWAFQQFPTLGSTEGGSLGSLVWETGIVGPDTPNPGRGSALWGLTQAGKPDGTNLEGSAVFMDDAPASAWVPISTARQDIRVARSLSPWGNGETGVSFRVVDANNQWQAYYSPALGGVWVGYWLNGGTGGFTHVATFNPGVSGWEYLRVTAVGNTISIYKDDLIGGWVLLGTITSAQFNTATRAGLVAPSLNVGNSLARYFRWAAMPI